MLPRIDRRVHSTRRGRGNGSAQREEVLLKKAGVLTIEEYIERRRDEVRYKKSSCLGKTGVY
jgi:hypothetical protein